MSQMFSIIIPNYNRAELISRAIKSVLDQDYNNFELIVVDDCSIDNSWDVISEIIDNRLRAYRLNKNSGAAAARNFGIDKAKGIYISLLDSDDYYEHDFLEKSFQEILNTEKNVGFIWTGVRYIERDGQTEFIWKPQKKETPYLTFLYSLHIGAGSGITFKRELFDICGKFREDLPAAEDTEFFLRITKVFNFSSVRKVLVNIDKTSSHRLSNDYKGIATAYNSFLPEHFSVIDNHQEIKLKFYYKLMWLNFHLGDQKKQNIFIKKYLKN